MGRAGYLLLSALCALAAWDSWHAARGGSHTAVWMFRLFTFSAAFWLYHVFIPPRGAAPRGPRVRRGIRLLPGGKGR